MSGDEKAVICDLLRKLILKRYRLINKHSKLFSAESRSQINESQTVIIILGFENYWGGGNP